jgi:hypothetical protein
MSRMMAMVVALTLVASAIPTGAISPACHGCCAQPRLAESDRPAPPCCRVSSDTPPQVARTTGAGAAAIPAAATSRLAVTILPASLISPDAAIRVSRPPPRVLRI